MVLGLIHHLSKCPWTRLSHCFWCVQQLMSLIMCWCLKINRYFHPIHNRSTQSNAAKVPALYPSITPEQDCKILHIFHVTQQPFLISRDWMVLKAGHSFNLMGSLISGDQHKVCGVFVWVWMLYWQNIFADRQNNFADIVYLPWWDWAGFNGPGSSEDSAVQLPLLHVRFWGSSRKQWF